MLPGHKIPNPLSNVQEWQNAAPSNAMVKNSTEWVKFIKNLILRKSHVLCCPRIKSMLSRFCNGKIIQTAKFWGIPQVLLELRIYPQTSIKLSHKKTKKTYVWKWRWIKSWWSKTNFHFLSKKCIFVNRVRGWSAMLAAAATEFQDCQLWLLPSPQQPHCICQDCPQIFLAIIVRFSSHFTIAGLESHQLIPCILFAVFPRISMKICCRITAEKITNSLHYFLPKIYLFFYCL